MWLPEVSICSVGEETFLTVNLLVGPGDDLEEAADRAESRVSGVRTDPLSLIDPHRLERPTIRSARPPGDFESAVEEATGRIGAGALEKVVLAREVIVSAPSAHDPAAVFGALREHFPSCFCFCCGTPEAAFVGASPELLIRRSGAGGVDRRSCRLDPPQLRPVGRRPPRGAVAAERQGPPRAPHRRRGDRPPAAAALGLGRGGEEPEVIRVANIQHLATPVLAQLAEPLSAISLAGLLHPTPAVGGEPGRIAAEVIRELEGMDRGWYAGPVGWMDATEDGEFCVALRSALLRDREARLYAGGGIVAGSDPAAELAETEVKLQALLPLLAE